MNIYIQYILKKRNSKFLSSSAPNWMFLQLGKYFHSDLRKVFTIICFLSKLSVNLFRGINLLFRESVVIFVLPVGALNAEFVVVPVAQTQNIYSHKSDNEPSVNI